MKISLTNEQIEILKKSVDGIDYYDCEQSAVQFLIEHRLCEMYSMNSTTVYATEFGKSKLVEARKKQADIEQEKAEKQSAEAKRLEERHEDYANEERRYRTQNKIAIGIPIITFILGLITEHFSGIVGAAIEIARVFSQTPK